MAKKFSKAFYNSKAWKDCKESYIRKMPIEKRGLCEQCYAEGKHTLGKELHHKIELTPYNMNDRHITLGHDNLVLLCYDCHQKQHNRKPKAKRYLFDSQGNIIPLF